MSLYRWLVGYTGRAHYWQHSKAANWVRSKLGVEIPPKAATACGWKEYKDRNKSRIGYWLVEEGFDLAQDIVNFIPDVYKNAKRYTENRFVTKPHYIDTKLSRGEWHEMDTRILHGLMETLVDFVEVEKAHRQFISDWLQQPEESVWFGLRKRQKWKSEWKTPDREAGLRYLDWEISLGDESPYQSKAAAEIKELYLWWKDIRPQREDPMKASGVSAYFDRQREEHGDGLFDIMCREETDEEKDAYRTMSDRMYEMEEQQEQEDEDMMVRLIKIRRSMWT